jgi:hypothetical protein
METHINLTENLPVKTASLSLKIAKVDLKSTGIAPIGLIYNKV